MPYCACFHAYARDPDGLGGTPLDSEDAGGILPGVLGMQDGRAPVGALGLLKGRIIVDLAPEVDECYALGPYSIFDIDERGDGVWLRAEFGEAVHRAKYANDQSAIASLSKRLANFVNGHPAMRSVAGVAAPPKSNAEAMNLPLVWARFIAESLGVSVVSMRKIRHTGPQKELDGLEDEQAVAERVRNSVQVDGAIQGDILVIDDTVRSGGMARELGRALKAADAGKVYALCVAKDAKFTIGGISLGRERWP